MLLESAKSWLVLGRVAVDAWVNDCHEREGGGDGKDGPRNCCMKFGLVSTGMGVSSWPLSYVHQRQWPSILVSQSALSFLFQKRIFTGICCYVVILTRELILSLTQFTQ